MENGRAFEEEERKMEETLRRNSRRWKRVCEGTAEDGSAYMLMMSGDGRELGEEE